MADKNSQRDAEHEEAGGTTEHFPQQDAVYEPGVGQEGAEVSQQKEKYRLYHAPEGGEGDDHAVSHRQTIEQFRALPVDTFGHLPADRLSLPLKRPPGFLANGNFTRSAQGRNHLVQFGQGFREPALEFLHPVAQNADGPVIVFQRVGQTVFLLHPFGCRERRVYF